MIRLKKGDVIELVPIKYSPVSEKIGKQKIFNVVRDDNRMFIVDDPWIIGLNGELKLCKDYYDIKIIDNYDLPEELFII